MDQSPQPYAMSCRMRVTSAIASGVGSRCSWPGCTDEGGGGHVEWSEPRLDVPVDLAISEQLPTVPLSAPFRRVLRAGHAGLLCAERVADAFDVRIVAGGASLSVRSICLAWWSTRPRCGLTDDFSAPCWSVRRIPTHGRLTPCGN